MDASGVDKRHLVLGQQKAVYIDFGAISGLKVDFQKRLR
jgi:hypothetical protein